MFKLDGLFPHDDGSATLRFSIRSDQDDEIGGFLLRVAPTDHGNTDSLIGRGYREMAGILGEWQGRLLGMAAHYEAQSAR
jgi:hypothetical protein